MVVVYLQHWLYVYYSISNRFFENQLNEICSHLTEKASKGWFPIAREQLQNHSNEGKRKGEKERATKEIRKGGEEKKAMVELLGFIMSYFGYSFWPKKLLNGKLKVHLTITFSKIRLHI